MFRSLAATALSLASACAWAASTPTTDAQWQSYLSVWANDGTASPEAVERFYASRVNYYGREMTPGEVYRDKSYLIRQWPARTYRVVPGSVATSCSADKNSCEVTLVMDYRSANPVEGIGVEGETTVSLELIKQDGRMKIDRENGVSLMRSSCRLASPDWRQKSNWRCSAYRVPSIS